MAAKKPTTDDQTKKAVDQARAAAVAELVASRLAWSALRHFPQSLAPAGDRLAAAVDALIGLGMMAEDAGE